jgi:hypothetical protein
MARLLNGIYQFLPVQLLLLHFRKHQGLLLFWGAMFLIIANRLASIFGSRTLFLSPEYLGGTGLRSMGIIGGAFAAFTMAWHITTFIVHSRRIPYLGAARQAFLTYCLNNSGLPLLFLIFYTGQFAHYQYFHEHASGSRIVLLMLAFLLGYGLILLVSFAYFFRTDRDLLKVVLSRITDPSRIRDIIPYDSLDYEFDLVRAETYLCSDLRIERIDTLEKYHHRVLATVLRRHHRNAIAATLFSLVLLIVMGAFMEHPVLRIPAGASFLLFFSVLIGLVGAVTYFFKSWQLLAWACFALLLSVMVRMHLFDLRSTAIGLNYDRKTLAAYDYDALRKLSTPERWNADRLAEEARLSRWKGAVAGDSTAKPPLIVVCVSGGGSRSAYWTFRTLQRLDSITGGGLYRNTVMITGASGGMLGAAYWREVHRAYQQGRIRNPYDPQFQAAIGKDLLNAIVFSLTTVDLVTPFARIKVGGFSYDKDRGYALEQELVGNTSGLLGGTIADRRGEEAAGRLPALIVCATIVNDGRRLLMAGSPVGYLSRPQYTLGDSTLPPIDAVDFNALFAGQNPQNLRLTTALRTNATFPYVMPVTRLPSKPAMNLMDAGLRDNFGVEVSMRYLQALQEWAAANARDVVLLQIRDTREHQVFPSTEQGTLGELLFDPATVITHKWEPFQSYYHSYLRDAGQGLFGPRFHYLKFQYMPRIPDEPAALNFHLTTREKEDLLSASFHPINRWAEDSLRRILAALPLQPAK